MTGSVSATILLRDIWSAYCENQYKPFSRFIAPCNLPGYRKGESWYEYGAYTPSEFDAAIKKIGTKVASAAKAREQTLPAYTTVNYLTRRIVTYWTDSDGQTWWSINIPLLNRLVEITNKVGIGRNQKFFFSYTEKF